MKNPVIKTESSHHEITSPGNFITVLLRKKLPLHSLFLVTLATIGLACFYEWPSESNLSMPRQSDNIELTNSQEFNKQNNDTTDIDITRVKDYGLTRPLILADQNSESPALADLKNDINAIIKNQELNKTICTASVFINDLDKSSWISINEKETYHPASLMKLTLLIAYLKKSESDPSILNKKLILDKNISAPHQTYEEESIQPGKEYTIEELIIRMITRSDNYATSLLNLNLDPSELPSLFHVLNMDKLNYLDPGFMMNSRQYSELMKILYNASYLSSKNSEKALSILTQTRFSNGLTRIIPKSIMVAHKFGEYSLNTIKELHESGIIYLNNKTYLITIMTKGANATEQANAVSMISEKTYEYFNR
jgi:beta-lactamase class A